MSSLEPSLSGEIPLDGMIEVLRDIEAKRITGRLRYTSGGESGEVELVSGQLALDQDTLPDGSDPVERLLALRAGIFVVHQRLPALAVSQGDDELKKGSLAVHAPSDLMTYCETAGLTGTLKLVREGRIVEMVYEAGELLAIRVDGRESADLSHVFSWEDGRFEIRVGRDVRSLVPEMHASSPAEEDPADREPTTQFVRPRAEDTGKHFLKVVEVALTDIVEHRAKAPHKGKGQTVAPPARTARPRPPTFKAPAPKKPREPTVRIVFVTADDDAAAAVIDEKSGRTKSTPPTRSAEGSSMAKTEKKPATRGATGAKSKAAGVEPRAEVSVADAKAPPASDEAPEAAEPSEDRADAAGAATAPAREAAGAPSAGQEALVSFGWAILVVLVGLGMLAALARLPPV